ncbi:hypothetical protein O181_001421 [Austropuccinia psidii MF-1]|uniref:Copia protein n=1 Tax=Austropuccinia psidii MF-1 TaxID=1389203 RepID=A0A9Q3BAY8_9BASI|nr:hypothetical protein [Austropuccinia psidii MF-1]
MKKNSSIVKKDQRIYHVKVAQSGEEEDQSSSVNEEPSMRRRIKITGPRHPTLINSEIREENILPYSRRPEALLTESTPLTYNQALKSNNHENWTKEINKEIQSMIDLEVWEEVPIKKDFKLAFLHVLKYLKGTHHLGSVYRKNVLKSPIAYSDADWGNCRITRRSTTGYLILFSGNLVIWKTRKQPTVSLSSAEAEYKALTNLISKLLWLKQFSEEIGILTTKEAFLIHEDNQGCIDTANSDCNTNLRRMKHMDIQLHFIREIIERKIILLTYTPTEEMLADFLTKAVSHPAISRALKELKLIRMEDKGGVKREDLSQYVSN